MIGSGYAGQIQPLVASLSPQYLKAIMPIDVMDDMYLNCYPGGIVSDINYPLCSYIPVINSISEAELYNTEEKLKMMLAEAKRDPELASNSYYYRGLDSFPPRHYTWNIDILLNPLKNSFWAKRSFGDRQVTIPSYLVALYYEYGESTISAFDIYNKIASDVPKKLMVIDPAVDKTSPYDKANPEILRWYDHWLKGIDTGIMDEPPIKLLMMCEGRYRYDTDWPSKHTVYTNFYLGPENTLSEAKCSEGEASPATLRHIPPTKQSQMPQDVPVLSYSTAPFAADTEISGPLSVKLYAAIDGSEAHFSVRLWDKGTTGRRQLLSTGHLKASHGKQGPEETLPYRVTNAHLNPTPVQPDKIYEYHFELAPIGNIFKAGHTLELEIKTMDQQYFDYMEVASLPRLYTSGRVAGPHPLASEVNISVFTGGNHASCVILPMVNGPTDWVK